MTPEPRVLVIVNATTSGPKRLRDWLEEDGIDPVVVEGAAGLPESLEGFDGLVMLGGGLMPDHFDAAPWLHTERKLAADAIADDLPTLGICLGGQLLADVGGGEVRENHGPPERGSTVITPTIEGRDDPVLRHLGDRAPMIQRHRDMITRLPDGAVLLATSELVEHQAFRLGENVIGLQFHPEASAESVERWDADALAAEGLDHAALVAVAWRDHEHNTAASRRMIGAFAERVRRAAHAADRDASDSDAGGDAR